MATPPKTTDRRVLRTRQMLKQAFCDVVREKGFAETTIQEVAERANVNRGTFYAHFTDKYALLDAIVREQFQELLASKLPPVPQWNRDLVHRLIQTVLEYFHDMMYHCRPLDLIIPLAEQAAHEELTGYLLAWLKLNRRPEVSPRVPLETIAQTMSWAILGAATRRSQEATSISSAQLASDVLLVLMEGVARVGKVESM